MFCEQLLTYGKFYAKPEAERDSALVDVLKVRLFSPESKSGAVEEDDHLLEADFNPIWGKARDVEKMMRYTLFGDDAKRILQRVFIVSFNRIFPWMKNS